MQSRESHCRMKREARWRPGFSIPPGFKLHTKRLYPVSLNSTEDECGAFVLLIPFTVFFFVFFCAHAFYYAYVVPVVKHNIPSPRIIHDEILSTIMRSRFYMKSLCSFKFNVLFRELYFSLYSFDTSNRYVPIVRSLLFINWLFLPFCVCVFSV